MKVRIVLFSLIAINIVSCGSKSKSTNSSSSTPSASIPSTPPAWADMALSSSREFLAAAAAGNKLLFGGGTALPGSWASSSCSLTSDTIDIYDVAKNTWSTAHLSQPRQDLVATTVGTKVLFAGGYTDTASSSSSSSISCVKVESNVVDIYDTATGTLSTAKLSRARYRLAAATIGNKAIFAGGESDSGYVADVDIYDDATGVWSTASLSAPRSWLAASAVGTKALFAGGEVPLVGYDQAINVIDIFDASTNSWSTAKLSTARENLAATTVGTKVMFAGGRANKGEDASVVDIYDSASGNWTTAQLSQARQFIAAASTGTKAVFLGGYAYPAPGITFHGNSAVIDIYDSATSAWSKATLPQGWVGMAAVSAGGKTFFAGGEVVNSKGVTETTSAVYVYPR